MSESRSKLTKSLSFLKRSFVAEWMVLTGLFLATLVMLYPLSLNPNEMVPEPADPLLNVWRMHWDKHSILSGVDSLRRLFDANIFYPYPMTLAYSEHFLMETALALPILLLADSHLLGMNLSVLLSFVLSAYGAYLLISDWTRNRWAGLFAGFLLAFAPYRYGHINHLELLVMQWMPLTLLSLHWLLTRTHRRYLVLFILFFNLQALSAVNYTFHLALACAKSCSETYLLSSCCRLLYFGDPSVVAGPHVSRYLPLPGLMAKQEHGDASGIAGEPKPYNAFWSFL